MEFTKRSIERGFVDVALGFNGVIERELVTGNAVRSLLHSDTTDCIIYT